MESFKKHAREKNDQVHYAGVHLANAENAKLPNEAIYNKRSTGPRWSRFKAFSCCYIRRDPVDPVKRRFCS